jgi:hypothetical protein
MTRWDSALNAADSPAPHFERTPDAIEDELAATDAPDAERSR